MPNLQIDETIENTSFLRNCMNIHSIQHRKRPRKLHQHAPANRHQLHQIAATKAADTSPTIFLLAATTRILYGIKSYRIIISSHHHIITSSYHHIIARHGAASSAHYHRITGAQPGQHPTQRGGDYRGGIYIAK